MEDIKNTSENVEVEGGATETENIEVEAKDEKTFTQEDLDKILNKKFAQWQKKTEEAKAEAERKAKLSEKERFAEEKKEFEAMRKQFEYEQRVNATTKVLASNNLPIEFADFLIAEDEESTNKRVELFKDSFNQALEKMVTERLKGNVPKVPTVATKVGLTKDDFKKMNMAQRIKLRNDDPVKYAELSEY